MELAHIVPISLLSAVPLQQSTHLVLSELVRSNEAYSRFYAERGQEGDRIILDNPVHEDRPVSIDHWLEAVDIIMPEVAVIPDVIDSGTETLANIEKALEVFTSRGYSGIELMAVPHAETQQGWLQCASRISQIKEISWLGISLERRFGNDPYALGRRRERVDMLNCFPERFDRFKLHLLGVSEAASELSGDPIWKRATSADTGEFAVWNLLGTPTVPPVPITQPYPGRGPLGGSFGYFFTGHPQDLSRRKFTRNLRQWLEYARREN